MRSSRDVRVAEAADGEVAEVASGVSDWLRRLWKECRIVFSLGRKEAISVGDVFCPLIFVGSEGLEVVGEVVWRIEVEDVDEPRLVRAVDGREVFDVGRAEVDGHGACENGRAQ